MAFKLQIRWKRFVSDFRRIVLLRSTMTEHIGDNEHMARRKSCREDDQTIELLSDTLQNQSLDLHTNVKKRPITLLDLPLSLVRDILQDVVQRYATPEHRTLQLISLLNMRTVHRKSLSYNLSPPFLKRFAQGSSMPN